LLTDPASLAWLFNIRGSDVVHNPLALGFAIVPTSAKPILFMDNRKVSAEIRDTLSKIIEFHEPDQLEDEIKKRVREKAVLCDENLLPAYLADVIKQAGGKIEHGRDPVVLPRAIKNPTEIEGTKKSQIRDGVAVCKFLCWLDHQKPSAITEISAAQKLEALRASNAIEMGSELEEISFDAISAFGPHAAIPHYRVSNKTSLQFESDTLYLIDSGGQYLDGTTDITRTVAVGNPPKSAVVDFTLVLKGHIAIATTRFPKGTRGVDLDPFARHALWQEGKDFNHGTGHGVGAYLNVHEGPQSISKRGMEVLKPGMIISNEPGYYVEGAYGIRIENLVLVTEQEKLENGNVETHSFETLTLAPIDTRLVAASMLTDAEREWLNDYHVWVRETLLPHLSDDHERDWLVATTKAI
ncbi:MAG: aminopeptidase family protein P, partial [Pseudomonadota bacterium]